LSWSEVIYYILIPIAVLNNNDGHRVHIGYEGIADMPEKLTARAWRIPDQLYFWKVGGKEKCTSAAWGQPKTYSHPNELLWIMG